ncbi:MAG: toll/interleukin-1 receptor domain-containing protein [Bryobacterales bacterium]|nr:toll/interleukin-1 receptor domain-containing protein [Bryobacterales bacterium]
MARLFISYRRDDSAAEAGRLSDLLRARFGDDEVFIDVESIDPGERFPDILELALMEAEWVLAVIGRNWTTVTHANGQRRLDDPGDYVRKELAIAIERKLRLVPVLVAGAKMPALGELPAELEKLRDYQAVHIRPEYFRRDADALAGKVAGRRPLVRKVAIGLAAAAALAIAAFMIIPRVAPRRPPHPSDFRLKLQVHASDAFGAVTGSPEMKLAHRKPKERGINLLAAGTPLGDRLFEYESPVLMPTQGEEYLGLLHRVVTSGVLTEPRLSEVCFLRGARSLNQDPLVRVSCEEGKPCQVARDDFGWAKPCPSQEARFALFPVVYAQGRAARPERGWVVPSFDTLMQQEGDKRNPAFTEFILKSGPLPALAKADRLGYAIRVNGTLIYFDGMPPETNLLPFQAEKGLDLRFALENLNFSGMDSGYEKVQVTLTFLTNGDVANKTVVPFRCIALRPIEERPVGGENPLGIRWSAVYHRAPVEDKYQIFLLSTRRATAVMTEKQRIDAAKLKLDEDTLVGVVRPPLGNNPSFGLILGVAQPSGQVKFSFDGPSSAKLCRALTQTRVRSTLGHATPFRRNISNRNESIACNLL